MKMKLMMGSLLLAIMGTVHAGETVVIEKSDKQKLEQHLVEYKDIFYRTAFVWAINQLKGDNEVSGDKKILDEVLSHPFLKEITETDANDFAEFESDDINGKTMCTNELENLRALLKKTTENEGEKKKDEKEEKKENKSEHKGSSLKNYSQLDHSEKEKLGALIENLDESTKRTLNAALYNNMVKYNADANKLKIDTLETTRRGRHLVEIKDKHLSIFE